MISIREFTAADGPAIAEVRRASWQAAYAGIIRQSLLDQATARPSGLFQPPRWRRTMVAVPDSDPAVVGYASFGPERSLQAFSPITPRASAPAATGQPPAAPGLTEAGLAGQVGEVYALYVTPDWWSTGTGRSLMSCAVAALTDGGYGRAVLWVLAANARARQFYETAGWVPDGASNVLDGLGGVVEVRYTRPL
ncbi:MAG: acetyltransferase [Actinomycetia bacterium]|nr:acetyltransferase [Actinomycetes bacterium]